MTDAGINLSPRGRKGSGVNGLGRGLAGAREALATVDFFAAVDKLSKGLSRPRVFC